MSTTEAENQTHSILDRLDRGHVLISDVATGTYLRDRPRPHPRTGEDIAQEIVSGTRGTLLGN